MSINADYEKRLQKVKSLKITLMQIFYSGKNNIQLKQGVITP